MKKVLISLLLGVTLVGGLVGCGEETISKAEYDEVVKSNEPGLATKYPIISESLNFI